MLLIGLNLKDMTIIHTLITFAGAKPRSLTFQVTDPMEAIRGKVAELYKDYLGQFQQICVELKLYGNPNEAIGKPRATADPLPLVEIDSVMSLQTWAAGSKENPVLIHIIIGKLFPSLWMLLECVSTVACACV